jgi:multidrug efflux pump subunit AcrA (membrane-fusion protein)
MLQVVRVRLGIENAQRIEVRSGDLKEGDSVVVGSRAGLKAGRRVQPKVISLAADSASKS